MSVHNICKKATTKVAKRGYPDLIFFSYFSMKQTMMLWVLISEMLLMSTNTFSLRNNKNIKSGHSCSKLTMSLVNIVKTLIIKYGIYANIFSEKIPVN